MTFKRDLSDEEINTLLDKTPWPFTIDKNYAKLNKVINLGNNRNSESQNSEKKTKYESHIEIPHFNQEKNKYKVLKVDKMYIFDPKTNEEKKLILFSLQEGKKGIPGKTKIVFSLTKMELGYLIMELIKLYFEL